MACWPVRFVSEDGAGEVLKQRPSHQGNLCKEVCLANHSTGSGRCVERFASAQLLKQQVAGGSPFGRSDAVACEAITLKRETS